MEVFLAWVSVILGVVGIAYGLYQSKLREQVQRLAVLQAWEVYQSAYQSSGWLNNVFAEVDVQKREGVLGEARARADSHYTKTIYNLYAHYENVTPELIRKWIDEGRIDAESEKNFLRYIGEK